MRDIRIFQDCELSLDTPIRLDDRASRHLGQVLRLAAGDELIVFNGNGNDYISRIASVDKKKVDLHIMDMVQNHSESELDVHLFQGVSKGDRMDTAIQKSVELGISSITPIICERTVVRTSDDRNNKKLQHWRNIIISACEQSGRARIPELYPITDYQTALDSMLPEQTVLLHPNQPEKISQVSIENKHINLVIGPEGGFSDREVELAGNAGVKLVTIGRRILRTETAPIAALSVLQARFGDY
jgi:16S rRNA (uracil1498-N3)-methyltransferase